MKTTDRLDNLRVASPCPVGWEQMTGDDRVRFCDQCSLRVYNISAMTRKQAESLIASTEGRICARLYRRADGTVITKDCPVGLRALRRQVARSAGAVFAVALSLCSNVFGSRRLINSNSRRLFAGNSVTPAFQTNRAIVEGQVVDPNGVGIRAAKVTLVNLQTNQKRELKADKRGEFRFFVFDFGKFSIKCEADGFHPFVQELFVDAGDDIDLRPALMVAGLVGIVVIEEPRRTGFDVNGVHVHINEK